MNDSDSTPTCPGQIAKPLTLLATADDQRRAKVFGVGLMKTGTSSLSRALRHLRLRCLHSSELHFNPNLIDILDSAIGSPVAIRYRELDIVYPGSKFILTVRDPSSWLDSWHAHVCRGNPLSFEYLYVRAKLFGRVDFDPEDCLRGFERHNAGVVEYFSQRPSDLLIMDIAKGDGYEKLCPFLGAPTPATPFPWDNRARKPDGFELLNNLTKAARFLSYSLLLYFKYANDKFIRI